MRRRGGFTLIELLVTVGIVSVIAGALVLYNRTAEQQILLAKSVAEVLSVLSRARSSAVAGLFDESKNVCGYGVSFSMPGTMIFFRDVAPCDQKYTSPGGNAASCVSSDVECVEKIVLNDKVKFASLGLANIDFVPPNPNVFIDQGAKQSAIIELATVNGNAASKIKVTNAGQITLTQ